MISIALGILAVVLGACLGLCCRRLVQTGAGARDALPPLPTLRGPDRDELSDKKETSMARQIVMDRTGDTRHEFDPRDAQALAEAERRFKELTGAGFTAAVRVGDGQSELIRSFDPAAEETIFIPRLKGG